MTPAGALRRWAPPVLAVAALLAVWEGYVRLTDVPVTVLPAPSRVVWAGWRARDQLAANTWPTLRAVLVGFAASAVVAFAVAVAMDTWSWLRRALHPLLVVSQTVPLFVVAPLLVRWFGFELTPKIVLVAVMTFFPMTVAWADGFAATRPETTDLLRSLGAGRWRRFTKGRVPTAVPWFLSGLRVALTYAVVAAIIAEYVGSRAGLGVYIRTQLNQFRTDLALAAVVVATVLTLVLVGCVDLLRRWLVHRPTDPVVSLARR